MAGRVRSSPHSEFARRLFARPVSGKPVAAGGTRALLTRLPAKGHVATIDHMARAGEVAAVANVVTARKNDRSLSVAGGGVEVRGTPSRSGLR